MTGYTIVDLETTGLFPKQHDRVLEIGLINVSDKGDIESEWGTLLNPQRDVGPTSIHGITAREVLDAPTFNDVAQHVISSLAGRTMVAHNARFDTQFLDYEFDRAGVGARSPTPSLCTMQLSSSFLSGSSRKLKDCCAAAHVDHLDEHTALGDARAVAGLLRYYLSRAGVPVPWASILESTRSHWWPTFEVSGSSTHRPVSRTATARRPDAWLDRITSALPRNPDPEVEAYLDVLEKAMLDGYLSAHEESALTDLALSLGLQRDQLAALHATYLDSMAIAAWEDGTVTDAEVADLVRVANILGLPGNLVQVALKRVEILAGETKNGKFRLHTGDQVVFTGDLSVPRDRLIDLAQQIGLRHGGVNKNTKVVVAADPDSQSGKAAKARSYGIPVVTEAAFARMLDDLH
ncbi:MAG: exonuclease domain-containing protein [Gammaproteobacteria bacterium]